VDLSPTTLAILGVSGSSAVWFLQKVLSPAATALGEGAAADVIAWKNKRIERAAAAIEQAAASLDAAGAVAVPVPGRVLWPILERASLEDDPGLTSAWSALLANAADESGPNVLPSFPSILAELSPKEAQLLNLIYEVEAKGQRASLVVHDPKNTARPLMRMFGSEVGAPYVLELNAEDYRVFGGNLLRLGVCYYVAINDNGHTPNRIPDSFMLRLTRFGTAFVRACHRA
jgi:hypothetical protein